MEEAVDQSSKKFRTQAGQAMIEYLILVSLTLLFARFVFFDPVYGFQGLLNSGMMRLGAALEENLKSGTRPGIRGQDSADQFAGARSNWIN